MTLENLLNLARSKWQDCKATGDIQGMGIWERIGIKTKGMILVKTQPLKETTSITEIENIFGGKLQETS